MAENMPTRHDKVKRSTVRVLVDGKPSGSGFIVDSSGLVATCFHVVQAIQRGQGNQTQVTFASSVEVEVEGLGKIGANLHPSCKDQGFPEALSKDYCLLQLDGVSNLDALPIGSFDQVVEGSEVYLCGFPLGIDQAVVARGMVSTKWLAPGYLNQGSQRRVAWLDATMNRGNSGGAVLLLADRPEEDVVIGIATFGLNPFAAPAEQLLDFVGRMGGNVIMMGVDFKRFASLVGAGLASNSLGVGGCVSIQYLQSALAVR